MSGWTRRLSYLLLLAAAGSSYHSVAGYYVATTTSSSSSSLLDPSCHPQQHYCHHRRHRHHHHHRKWWGAAVPLFRATTVRWHSTTTFLAAAAKESSDVVVNVESSQEVAPPPPPPPPQQKKGALNTSSSATSSSSLSSPAFFDQVVLHVRAGSGGAGATTYETIGGGGGGSSSGNGSGSTKKQQRGKPHGGNGGRGGHIIAQVDPHLNTLAGLVTAAAATRKGELSLRAEHGQPGQRRYKPGNAGKDCVIRVPPGTIVEELVGTADHRNWTHIPSSELQWIEVTRLSRLEEFSKDEEEDWDDHQATGSEPMSSKQIWEPFVLAEGGRGGDGNGILARSNQRNGNSHLASRPREGPTAGERKTIRLTLQFLADVAVIGVPNAGKSTFLAAVTRAKPKIANYPFTTVIPNLGVWHDDEEEEASPDVWDRSSNDADDGTSRPSRLVLCDVPGLIDGASLGVGLGHAFLRHAELCHALVHVVDASSPNAVRDYQLVNNELIQYSPALASKPQVVLLNKIDAFQNDPQALQQLQEQLRHAMPHSRLLTMSAKDGIGVDDVMRRLATFVQKVRAAQQASP